jgi:rubrerythrin
MKIEMDTLSAIQLIKQIESKVCTLYESWAKKFTQDAEASFFFYRLYIEEIGHAQLAEYCQDILLNNTVSTAKTILMDIEDNILEQIDMMFKDNTVTIDTALKHALFLEVGMSEAYLNSNFKDLNGPFIKYTIEYMAHAGHAERILEFIKTHSITP